MVASTAERFIICKPRWAIENYEALLARLEPRSIFEVGIRAGGSTAFISQLARPAKLVSVELSPEPVTALSQFIERRGLGGSVSPHYGVDQADSARLSEIVDDEFGSEPLDLVIDDASHQLVESRITFEALFPRLRPGGEYLLEDWGWAHAPLFSLWPRRTPLTLLVFELVMACGHHPDIITEVIVDRGWAIVRRGPAEVDPTTFDLTELCGERGRDILARIGTGGTEPRPRPRRRRFRLRR